MEVRDFKGVWIPKEIWLNKELSVVDRCLLAEINSLDGENHCFATNEYFAEFFNLSVPTITRSLNQLKKLGLIETEMQKTSTGTQRVIKVVYGECGQNDQRGCNQNDDTPLIKMINIYNNTNNKNINTLSKDNVLRESLHDNDYLGTENEKPKKKNLYQKCLDMIYEFTNDGKLTELLIQYLNLLLEKSKNEGKPLYANQFKGMLNKLDEICTDGHYGEVVQQSIVKGYIGFFPVNNYSSKAQNYVPDTNKAPQHHAGEKVKNKDGTLKEY